MFPLDCNRIWTLTKLDKLSTEKPIIWGKKTLLNISFRIPNSPTSASENQSPKPAERESLQMAQASNKQGKWFIHIQRSLYVQKFLSKGIELWFTANGDDKRQYTYYYRHTGSMITSVLPELCLCDKRHQIYIIKHHTSSLITSFCQSSACSKPETD